MTPFAVQQIWHAGHPVKVDERGSTLALLVEATVRRITATATSPGGCPCCRCSSPIRRTADLRRHRRGRPQRYRGIPRPRQGLLLPPRLRHRRRHGRLRARRYPAPLPRPRATIAVYEQRGEFSAAVELRRLFPAVTDTAQARACARTIASWQPLPVLAVPRTPEETRYCPTCLIAAPLRRGKRRFTCAYTRPRPLPTPRLQATWAATHRQWGVQAGLHPPCPPGAEAERDRIRERSPR